LTRSEHLDAEVRVGDRILGGAHGQTWISAISFLFSAPRCFNISS
jgi:hypothetical protein